MCEDTLGIQPRQGTGRRNGVHTAFKMLSPDKETQPGHSGIHLDVDPAAFRRISAASALYSSALAMADTACVSGKK